MTDDYLSDLFSARGKTVLVTGGATGIGLMIATAFVRAGARVLIASRKGADCETAALRLNEQTGTNLAEGLAGDVSNEAGVDALVAAVRARCDRLDVLVNNAGTSWGAPYGSFPFKAWGRVMDVNVAGLFSLSQGLLDMLANSATLGSPARIINIGSVMGTVPLAESAYSYAASKAAVHHLTRILAAELAGRSITVNAIAPGPIPSNMTSFATGTDDGRAAVAATVPSGRLGQASDIAGAVLFLAGAAGAYTTGAVVPLDGGLSVAPAAEVLGAAV